MRHLIIICLVILLSSTIFAGNYDKKVRKEYYRKTVDLKYRAALALKEEIAAGKLRELRVKQNNKIYRRQRRTGYYYGPVPVW